MDCLTGCLKHFKSGSRQNRIFQLQPCTPSIGSKALQDKGTWENDMWINMQRNHPFNMLIQGKHAICIELASRKEK